MKGFIRALFHQGKTHAQWAWKPIQWCWLLGKGFYCEVDLQGGRRQGSNLCPLLRGFWLHVKEEAAEVVHVLQLHYSVMRV